MNNVRLANSEDEADDLYSGFNEYNPMFDTGNLNEDEGFQKALQTSHGKRPPMTSFRKPIGTAAGQRANLTSSMGRSAMDGESGVRPMTSVSGAGYMSGAKRSTFDPMSQGKGASIVAPPLDAVEDNTPEEKIKAMEREISDLIEKSVLAGSHGDHITATEKAKEAGKKERLLVRQREQAGLSDGISLDLTYAVLFNLAVQYEAHDMYSEALNMYNVIAKNKMFQNSGKIKLNIGNIHFKQGNLPKAIKFFRMALDQVPSSQKEIRIKIMQNIGAVFVKMGQYNDAVTSYEHIMSEKPDFQSGMNLILCYFALGEKEKMTKSFMKLLNVNLGVDDEDKYTAASDNPQESVYLDAIRNDPLRQLERKRKAIAERCIIASCRVIAPVVGRNFSDGFEWCVEQVKNSAYHDLANDLEIHKAIMYLKDRDFTQAVSILKTFEKKDTQVKSQAATNLSFIYYLQGNRENAKRYANSAVKADRFNSASLTNKANCLFMDDDVEGAITLYKEAIDNDSSCQEALFNLGLAYKRRGKKREAIEAFTKLHNIARSNAQVLYQLALLNEMLGDYTQAMEWMMQCISIVPTDANVLSHMADLCEREDNGDQTQAFAYRQDSYKFFPADISTLEWLGAYYVESQFSEKAAKYFERAAVIQPNEVKWQLMVASCYRRSGSYQQAFEKYKQIHASFPENVECLKYLNRLCSDLGLTKELKEYANKLKKAEKMNEAKLQRAESAGRKKKRSSVTGTPPGSGGAGRDVSSRQRRVISDQPGGKESKKKIDASYQDPLGPAIERPKTGAVRRQADEEDDFEVGDDLLPE